MEWPGSCALQLKNDSAGPLGVLDPNFTKIALYLPGKNLFGTPCCAQPKPEEMGQTRMYSSFKVQGRSITLWLDFCEGHVIHMEQSPKCPGINVNEVFSL